jgi:D-aspartate ligase
LNKIPVLILGMYFPGYSLLRDFSRLDIPVYGADIMKNLPGFKSKYGIKNVCPNPANDFNDWLDWMINFAKDKGKVLLFCTSDRFLIPLKNAYEKLKEKFIYTIPHTDLIEEFTSKRGIYNLSLKYNFPAPKTLFVNNYDVASEFLDNVDYPIISKPEFSKDWMKKDVAGFIKGDKVFQLSNKNDALEFYNKMKNWKVNIIFQEIIPGPDDYLYYGAFYLNESGETLASFIGRKHRVIPVHFGSASFVETVNEKELNKKISVFLKESGYRGICGVEIKKDERDNEFKLVEINPRYSLWDELGNYMGQNIGLTAYNDLTKSQITSNYNIFERIYWLSIQRDITAFTYYNKEHSMKFRTWFKSINVKPKIISDIRKDDINYSFSNIITILKYILKYFKIKLLK